MDVVATVSSELVTGDRRVSLKWTIEEFAKKMEPITGIPPAFQELQVSNEFGELQARPANSFDTLADTGVRNGWHLFIGDLRDPSEKPQIGGDEVVKFELPQSEYEKREDSVLAWKRQNKLGRFGPGSVSVPEPCMLDAANQVDDFALNARVIVHLKSGRHARGVIRYVGPIDGLPSGVWVGVELDSADGKNNGTVAGHKLFDAAPLHGIAVRPPNVSLLAPEEEEL